MENKFNDEEFLFDYEGLDKKVTDLEEAVHKQRLYLEILSDLDGDDFYMDYETYEELD